MIYLMCLVGLICSVAHGIGGSPGDVGGEIGQADDPGIVGSVQFLAPGELGEFAAGTLQQPRFEQMRSDDRNEAQLNPDEKGAILAAGSTPLGPPGIGPPRLLTASLA